MAVYKIVTEIPATSGLVEDQAVSRFFFQTNEAVPTDDVGSDLIGHVAACFMNITSPGTVTLASLYSPLMSRSVVPVGKAYDAVVGGSPIAVESWAGALSTPASSVAYPPEVACCLSFKGDLDGIPEETADDADPDSRPERPASRRRGRFFFGPTCHFESGAAGLVPNLLRDALLGFGTDLADIPVLAGDEGISRSWVVFSKGSGELGTNTITPVTTISVDNAWDTQRRRGRPATARTIITL